MNSEYIIMRPKDKILVDSEIYRDYTVMSGMFKVTKIDTSNNCIDLMIIKFSDRIQLKSNNTYSYVLQALTQSKILVTSNMKFPIMSEIKANEPVCNSLETLVDTFYYKESQKRFKTLFLFLIKNVGIYTKFGIIITYSLSHQDIADIIGSNRITITRIINNLNRKKIISIYKRRFILHDPLLLVQLT